ncbi:DUF1648 domain-containing protein [Planococcus donghaensis]|uniref:DUF1648 domain-containing protein n=1 Tax=Planococcus donghaensis TaxID=414778 RepID=A0A1C7EHM6_9BACL|nr:DUF1648 domain-containing protein [Planococcus donghaensis]ANU23225.1 hypothetical protein BCM40_07520 [Planococcus donghaensis]
MVKQQKKPVTQSLYETFLNAISLLSFIFAIIFLVFQLETLPEKVPVHFDETGRVDRLGNKVELLLLPLIGTIVWLGLTILEKYPHLYNYLNLTEKNKEAQYKNGRLMVNVLKNEIILLFSFIIFQSVRIASGAAVGLGAAFGPIFLTVIFGSILFFVIRMLKM